jgi:pimeloyl-ACP methyl ester carboxylesterase
MKYEPVATTEGGAGSTSGSRSIFKDGGGGRCAKFCCCITCAAFLVGAVWMTIVQHISGIATESVMILDQKLADAACGAAENLQMSNITDNIYWVGCGKISKMSEFGSAGDGPNGKCTRGGCVQEDMMNDMQTFNKRWGGKLVHYPSRQGEGKDKDVKVVTLTGWWLPAPDDKGEAPRIVVQHGFEANSNEYRVMYVAYLLRSVGFSVLVNNLRDHCYSDHSKDPVIQWGHAYPYDLLGAWDYAQKADGEGRRTLDASKVGVLGMSMGGFTVQNALGIEPKIPAAWIDGAPWTPKVGYNQAMLKAGFLSAFTHSAAWKHVKDTAMDRGVNLDEHLPEKTLPNGPDTKRPIFVTANKADLTVPYSSSQQLAALLQRYPKKYELEEFWTHSDSCKGIGGIETHCVDHLRHPKEYKTQLCMFWTKVFDPQQSFKCLNLDSEGSAALLPGSSETDVGATAGIEADLPDGLGP